MLTAVTVPLSHAKCCMRHGRKSRSKKIEGYKRHVLKDLESGVVCAVALTRANTPESAATVDLERQSSKRG